MKVNYYDKCRQVVRTYELNPNLCNWKINRDVLSFIQLHWNDSEGLRSSHYMDGFLLGTLFVDNLFELPPKKFPEVISDRGIAPKRITAYYDAFENGLITGSVRYYNLRKGS